MAGTEIDFGRWDESSANFEGRGQGGTGDIRYFRDPETGYYYAAMDVAYKGKKSGIGQGSKFKKRKNKMRTEYIRMTAEELEDYKRFARGKNKTAWRGKLGAADYEGPGSMGDYGAMFKKLRDQQEEAAADYSTGSRGAKRKEMLLSAANVTEAYRDAYMQQGWGGAQRGRR